MRGASRNFDWVCVEMIFFTCILFEFLCQTFQAVSASHDHHVISDLCGWGTCICDWGSRRGVIWMLIWCHANFHSLHFWIRKRVILNRVSHLEFSRIKLDSSGEMATIVESKAYFRKRWSEIGLEQDVLQAFELAGIDTITKYAFARVPPGQNLTQQELTDWFNEITGSDPTPGQVAQIRQLHFESHTLVIAQLKSQVESPVAETAQPKKIPQSERLSRMKRLKDEVSGVLMENELEPSTSLLEYAVHLEQCDILRYIPVEKCQSRHFEMRSILSPKSPLR